MAFDERAAGIKRDFRLKCSAALHDRTQKNALVRETKAPGKGTGTGRNTFQGAWRNGGTGSEVIRCYPPS